MVGKIAICSLHIGLEYARLTRYSVVTKQLYCSHHGYDYIQDESVYDRSRHVHPAWAKLDLLLKVLDMKGEAGEPKYDWVVWLDADLYIMTPEHKLEGFIERLMKNEHQIMIGSDWKMSNTGCMFIRNTAWSVAFLRTVGGHTGFEVRGNYEQDAFQDLHEKNFMEAGRHIVVAAPREFNSYWFTWERGDFILHFAGCKNLEGLDIQLRLYCPVRRHDDDDESYEARIEWLKEEYKRYREWRQKL
jgi:hypothetical protein